MVKLLGFAFVALLAAVHIFNMQGDAYLRPLSMFRDCDPAWVGYAMFALLVAIGMETVRTAFRVDAEGHAAIYLIITGLLSVVAITPSSDLLHTVCSLVLMVVMFVFYAALLYYKDSMFWLVMHLLTPSVLMMASRLESYGVWQKGMILYFLAAIIVHQGVLARALPKRRKHKRRIERIQVGRRQMATYGVYDSDAS